MHQNKEIHEVKKLKTHDGLLLDYQVAIPQIIDKSVFLVHGIGDHKGRYRRLVEDFNNQNIAVFLIDLRGHGESEGRRGYIPNYEAVMNDITIWSDKMANDYPIQKDVIYGHSMGGNIVANFVLDYNNGFKKFILSSPWLKLANDLSTFQHKLLNFVYKFYPTFKLNRGIKLTDISTYSRFIGNPDHPGHYVITAPLLKNMIAKGKHALDNFDNIMIPGLVFHAQKDNLTQFQATVEAAEKNQLVEMLKLEGSDHETHNSEIWDKFVPELIEWIKS